MWLLLWLFILILRMNWKALFLYHIWQPFLLHRQFIWVTIQHIPRYQLPKRLKHTTRKIWSSHCKPNVMSMLASLLCTRRGKNFAHYTETLFLEHIFTGDSEAVPEIKKNMWVQTFHTTFYMQCCIYQCSANAVERIDSILITLKALQL